MNSKKIYISPYKKKNGCSKLYLQVLIGRRNKKLFDLELEWPKQHFNEARGICMPRYENDPDAEDYNIILDDAQHRANEIFKSYRLQDRRINMDLFTREWFSVIDRNDFVSYMEKKMLMRLRDRDIKDSTYANHQKTLVKLKDFTNEMPFIEIDFNWAKKFDSFLKKNIVSRKTNGMNARWTHHKIVRAYMKLATSEDHIKFENPYDYFSPKTAEGTWKPIYEEDLKKIIQYYGSHKANQQEKRCLRRFLFACSTSMRISDLIRVKENWFHSDNILRYVAFKNRDKHKVIEIPLVGLALTLFNDAIKDMPKGSRLFYTSEEQSSNRMLKRIADRLGITRDLHHHVGRSTFITLYLKNGGNLDMAQHYAGHHDIRTTMLYNHIDQERIRNEIIDFGSIV